MVEHSKRLTTSVAPDSNDEPATSARLTRSTGDRRRPPSARSLVLRFALAALLALAVVAVATAFVSRRVAEREGIEEAKRIAFASGRGVVQPALTDRIVEMEPDAVLALDEIVKSAVLRGSLVRVKLWREDGTIVYSDEGRLIGQRYPLGPDELSVLRGGPEEAEVSNLGKPENRFEARQGKLLETYVPVTTPDGTPLLFEAYFRYERVVEVGQSIWFSFAFITIGALVVLQLVQLPLAWSLASSLERSQEQRELLLRHAVEASDRERRRIAQDLHDGVVQDLTGVSYALAAGALKPGGDPDGRRLLEETGMQVRDSIGALRSLLVDIYPPSLREEGLGTSLDNLVAGLAGRGIRASLEVEVDDHVLPVDVEALLYRGAQEAVRNVATHSGATAVSIRVTRDGERALLVVEDDGRGFEPAAAGMATEPGHVGLRGLSDLVAEAGGTVEIASAPERGTEVRVEIPLEP